MVNFNWRDPSTKTILEAEGDLIIKNLPFKLPTPTSSNIQLDLSKVKSIDTSGINYILSFYGGNPTFINLSGDQANVIELVKSRSDLNYKLNQEQHLNIRQLISSLGENVSSALHTLSAHLTLFGQCINSFIYYLLNPRKIRTREIFSQLQQTALNAIPVIILVNFLIGIVMAYLLSMQAEKYGASIFVVDGVALAMCREMSPIIVAIILAGRSGSAFTAQLGAMKLTEEIDALKSIGLNTFDVLIFPRILSLLIALPLLVFIGDLFGMYGGMLVTKAYFDLTAWTYFQRLEEVLLLRHILVGLIKAPAFAFAIGLIACRVGLEVSQDARSVGLATTKTVVRSIVIVILLNASFTVVFANIGF